MNDLTFPMFIIFLQVFDVLRERSPQQLEKLSIVAGDITEPRLGLDEDTLQRISQVTRLFSQTGVEEYPNLNLLIFRVPFHLRIVIVSSWLC